MKAYSLQTTALIWLLASLPQLLAHSSDQPAPSVSTVLLGPPSSVLRPPSSDLGAPLDAFAQNRRLGRGVNIIGYDPIWRNRDQARFQARYFQMLKRAGFDSVRINLHAFRHMDTNAAADWVLSPAWLETLDWAVQGAGA